MPCTKEEFSNYTRYDKCSILFLHAYCYILMKIGYYYVWAGVVLNLIISIDGKHGCIWLCDNTNINNSTSITLQ